MKYLLTVLMVCLAVPAMAQQERECRGKQPIDLGNGVAGCVLEIGTGAITATRTRDDGASSKSNSRQAGFVNVALFGGYSDQRSVIGARMKAICRTLLPDIKRELAGVRYDRIIMRLTWPRVANPGTFVPKSRVDFAVQPAFTNANCRGIRFFG